MEFRFGVCTLNMPTIVVAVGTGEKYLFSEVCIFDEESTPSYNMEIK